MSLNNQLLNFFQIVTPLDLTRNIHVNICLEWTSELPNLNTYVHRNFCFTKDKFSRTLLCLLLHITYWVYHDLQNHNEFREGAKGPWPLRLNAAKLLIPRWLWQSLHAILDQDATNIISKGRLEILPFTCDWRRSRFVEKLSWGQ